MCIDCECVCVTAQPVLATGTLGLMATKASQDMFDEYARNLVEGQLQQMSTESIFITIYDLASVQSQSHEEAVTIMPPSATYDTFVDSTDVSTEIDSNQLYLNMLDMQRIYN